MNVFLNTRLITYFLFFFIIGKMFSQDIKGGYIKTKWLTGTNYNVEIKLFCDASKNINRPTISVIFGDVSNGSVPLVGSVTINSVTIKTYSINHTYNGPGTYYLTFEDTFRVASIKNILVSDTQHLIISSLVKVNQFGLGNTPPSITNYPIYLGVNGTKVYYDPMLTPDPDGDSLSFSLLNCLVPNYYIPNGVTLNGNGLLSFSKDSVGLYAFTYKITEWRKDFDGNYFVIGTSQIDFVMDITSNVGINVNINFPPNFFIYPNPTSNKLNISLNKANSENYSLEVLNCLGQIVIKTNYSNEINVTDLPKGLYILKFVDKNNSAYSFKFVKE